MASPKQLSFPGISRLNQLYAKSKQNVRRWANATPEFLNRKRVRARDWSKNNPFSALPPDVKSARVCAVKTWEAANIEKVRVWRRDDKRKRRAKKAGAGPSNVRSGDLKRLLTEQAGLCTYCGVHLGPSKHLDHIVPLALGGGHVIENLQYLCPPCNIAKGARHPVEHEKSIGFTRTNA